MNSEVLVLSTDAIVRKRQIEDYLVDNPVSIAWPVLSSSTLYVWKGYGNGPTSPLVIRIGTQWPQQNTRSATDAELITIKNEIYEILDGEDYDRPTETTVAKQSNDASKTRKRKAVLGKQVLSSEAVNSGLQEGVGNGSREPVHI